MMAWVVSLSVGLGSTPGLTYSNELHRCWKVRVRGREPKALVMMYDVFELGKICSLKTGDDNPR
jgi:hypothetical protein